MTISLARNVGNLGNVLSTNGKYATGTTPPALDSSTNLVTTAFVKASGHTYSNIFSYSASTSLSTTQIGGLVQVSTGGLIITLPPIGNSPTGATLTFLNPLATGNVTIKGNVNDLITSPFSTTGVNTLVLYPNESLDIVSNSINWEVIKYAQLNAPGFASPTVSVTPGHFDNSTLIPNTAWEAARGVQYNTSSSYITATSTTMTAANLGGIYSFETSASQAVTMPATTGVPAGAQITFLTGSTTTLTVTGTGTNMDVGNGVVASFAMPGANSVTLVYNGTGTWIAVGIYPFNRSYLATTVTNINTSISNEATTRLNADNALQSNINSEANTRLNADNALQNNINGEANNRVNGDNNLQNQLNAISSVYGIRSYYFIQQSQWSGGFGPGGNGTISGVPGSWTMTSATQISGDNVGLGYRYA